MRNKNLTQERRYATVFVERLKHDDYLNKLNSVINAIKNKNLDELKTNYEELKKYSTKGLSVQIRKTIVETDKKIVLLETLTQDDESSSKMIATAYSHLLDVYNKLRVELMKLMIN